MGVRFDGVQVIAKVSPGAVPVGPELTITAGEGPVISELAGQPALVKLRDVVDALPDDERRLIEHGLLVGIVIEPTKPEYVEATSWSVAWSAPIR